MTQLSNSLIGSLLVVWSVACLSNIAMAKDFGKQGHTFAIQEEGFITMIQRKLKAVNIAAHEQKMQELARKRVEEPQAVKGITKATSTVSHNFDPSYVLDKDVFLPCGKMLYAQGTTVNPLDHMQWSGVLVFIDSTDKAQVAWAVKNYMHSTNGVANSEAQVQHDSTNVAKDVGKDDNKIILVGGRPLDLQQEIGHAVYFDQFGELTKKFNIAHVPAIVQQDGKFLRVTEVNIKER